MFRSDRRLRGADEFLTLAGRLVAGPAVRARVVGGEKRTDDELARLYLCDGFPDVLDEAAIFMAHWRWPVDRVEATDTGLLGR